MKKLILLLSLLLSVNAYAGIVQVFFDINGQPLHTRDEFEVQMTTQVQQVPQGYNYIYTIYSLPNSIQSINAFSLQIPSDAVVVNTSILPSFGIWRKREPKVSDRTPKIAWVTSSKPTNPDLIFPGQQVSGFSFISPYPPGVVVGYAVGANVHPAADLNWPDTPAGLLAYDGLTPYGPGKVFPVIGPVKPAVVGGSNYTVLSCAGLLCDVQISVLGPQDVNGTTYTYAWSGAFGIAQGAQPVVQLTGGTTYPVTLTISDATGVLVTMNQDVVVPRLQVVLMTAAQLAALTPAQLAAFVAALTSAEVLALTPAQVAVVIAALTPLQIAMLAPTQLAALTPAQANLVSASLTPAQLAGVTANHDESDDEDSDSDEEHDDDKSEKDRDDD